MKELYTYKDITEFTTLSEKAIRHRALKLKSEKRFSRINNKGQTIRLFNLDDVKSILYLKENSPLTYCKILNVEHFIEVPVYESKSNFWSDEEIKSAKKIYNE